MARHSLADGKVVRALKSVCLNESNTDTSCIKDCVLVDTDTVSLGGHGTHVVSIAAGRKRRPMGPTTT